jgi:hypothetical protein
MFGNYRDSAVPAIARILIATMFASNELLTVQIAGRRSQGDS